MGSNGAQYAGGKKLFKKKQYEQRVEKRYMAEKKRQAATDAEILPEVKTKEDSND